MKTFSSALSFGFSTVKQTRTNPAVPELHVATTVGGFRITPMVSRLLGLKAGDNVMFITNVDNINDAINGKAEAIVNFCQEQGLDIDSPEAFVAIHKEFDLWGIAKGVQEFDSKGTPKTAILRLSKEEKERRVAADFDEVLAQALASNNEELKDSLTQPNITKDEQIAILSVFVQPETIAKYSGARTNNPSGMTGVGVGLNFSDSNVWNQLKADLGVNKKNVARVYEVDVDNIQTVTVHNGYQDVEVPMLLLGKHKDVVRNKPAESAEFDSAEELDD